MAVKMDTYEAEDTGNYLTVFAGPERGQTLKGQIRCHSDEGDPSVDYLYVSVTDPDAPLTTGLFVRSNDGTVLMIRSLVIQHYFWQMMQVRGHADEHSLQTFDEFMKWIEDESDPDNPNSGIWQEEWMGPFGANHKLNPLLNAA